MFEQVKPLKFNSSEVNIFFTSDLHFGHKNIIKFCNRPWETTEEMDEALIANWNSVVGEEDIVFDLGDFAFATNGRWKELIQRLNGKHYLILGNHDVTRWPGDKTMELFDRVEQQMIIYIDNRCIYLNHYPYLCYGGSWKNPEHAVWQLHGHVHTCPNSSGADDKRMIYKFPYQYDIGVDNNNYVPVSWNQVKEHINKQVLEWKNTEKNG
jgi:calcineurin-like phosphoesterase family protein|nr:MAG TPA: metallophosphatase domain protein [Bacteriophage sp.]